MTDQPDEAVEIQIDEVKYLRRVVDRLRMRAEAAEDAADKYAAICDMQQEEVKNLRELNEKLSDTVASMQNSGGDAAPLPPAEHVTNC